MTTIYSMPSCPDCAFVTIQAEGDSRYEIIDIGADVRHLKAFLRLRDTSPAFAGACAAGAVGIPCFVLADGTVTLSAEEAGLVSMAGGEGAACRADGKGC